jgi:DNA-binding MarR family transcriptional regulator
MTPDPPVAPTSPLVDAVVELSFAVLDILTRAAAEHDLSLTQLRLLGVLRDRTPSMAEIADFLGLDRSSVSGLIDRAEKRDLVARRTSAEDARVTIIDLTPAGIRVGERVVGTVATRIETILDGVSATERARFTVSARSIIAAATAPGHR